MRRGKRAGLFRAAQRDAVRNMSPGIPYAFGKPIERVRIDQATPLHGQADPVGRLPVRRAIDCDCGVRSDGSCGWIAQIHKWQPSPGPMLGQRKEMPVASQFVRKIALFTGPIAPCLHLNSGGTARNQFWQGLKPENTRKYARIREQSPPNQSSIAKTLRPGKPVPDPVNF